jgi:hypothetical protein
MVEPTQGITLFRRNLTLNPFIIEVGLTPKPLQVGRDNLAGAGVTSFKITNPNPFYVWYRGWNGAKEDMPPNIKGMGHYIGPGVTDINRSQVPDWIAAVADDEPGFPIFDANGNFLYEGKRLRLVMIYGAGG